MGINEKINALGEMLPDEYMRGTHSDHDTPRPCRCTPEEGCQCMLPKLKRSKGAVLSSVMVYIRNLRSLCAAQEEKISILNDRIRTSKAALESV